MQEFYVIHSFRKPIHLVIILSLLWLASCMNSSPAQPPTSDPVKLTQAFENALLTAQAAFPTSTISPTFTPIPPTPTFSPTPTLTRTAGPPPTLPPKFTSSLLKPGVVPQTYISNTCEYLKNRWDPAKSAPGTVVMPIMYHSITDDYKEIKEDTQIRHSELFKTLKHAKDVGFETITTEQLVGFLEHNNKIPQRSLLLILDDRRPGVIKEHFMKYLEEYNWTLTLGWLIGDTDTRPATNLAGENFKTLWEQIEAYYATGRLDVQAHGYIHNINITEVSTLEFIRHEIVDSRTVLQEHFYCKDPISKQVKKDCSTTQPLAYIWPGGSFTKKAAEVARSAGYKVGFTINPRGPVMYNWVPLAEKRDPNSPSWIPEVPVGDPLMVLPRYWSNDAAYRIDDVINISKQAIADAQKNRANELAYYDVICEPLIGKIPGLNP